MPSIEVREIGSQKLEARFNALAGQWYRETGMLSFIKQKAMHRAYQQIIGMGEAALPFIFRELQKGKGDWIWALESITGSDTNPAPPGSNFKQAIEAWIKWGEAHGYVA